MAFVYLFHHHADGTAIEDMESWFFSATMSQFLARYAPELLPFDQDMVEGMSEALPGASHWH